MHPPPTPLPLLPASLLRRHHCGEPNDTRFRSAARLRQSLWREEHGYACGRYLHPDGRTCRLGSMVSARVGQRGVNLIDASLIPLVQYEIAYREVGAVIHTERLWCNLLTSQALAFNLFGPFKQRPALATAVMRRLVPDLVADVTEVLFEHSPGRGHPRYTADHTAFDVLLRCTTPQGRAAFVAIEVKFSEAPAGIASPARPRYDALSRDAGVYRDPDAPALRFAPVEQFWREQLLVASMLMAGEYDAGRLLVIGPALNTECQTAITRYRNELVSDDPAETRFQAITLEDLVTAIGCAGGHAVAERVSNRYLNLEPVHRALVETFRPEQPAA